MLRSYNHFTSNLLFYSIKFSCILIGLQVSHQKREYADSLFFNTSYYYSLLFLLLSSVILYSLLINVFSSVCATHPWTVLGVGIVIAVILSSGIALLDVTTDPVKLWASPNSRSLQEKNFFDSHFTPFYRTEMLIITPVGVEKVIYFVFIILSATELIEGMYTTRHYNDTG